MSQINYTVIRNEMCPSTEVAIREGHNDRRSKTPLNADIVSERKEMNVYFHQNFTPDGQVETYQETINRLLAERKIVKYNFKPKSAIVDEFILDVNTDYFEQNGGYEFAKRYYEEAYRYAVKEAGSEDYIVSAVLHADERNKELSERYGRDVYHYHLHVVYVPIVQKEIKYTKRAGSELVGKVKEVIPQINHTDKWPRKKSGRGYFNEYSKLQDRYHQHMVAAGYTDLTRGERGSTAEHLDVLDFKIKKDSEKLADVSAQVGQTEAQLDSLSAQIKKKEAKSDKLDEQIAVKEKAKSTIAEINKMGTPRPVLSGYTVTDDEMKKLKSLARKSVNADKQIADSKKKMAALEEQIDELSIQLRDAKAEVSHWHREYTSLWNEVKDFIGAIRKFPARLREFVAELFRPEREAAAHEQEHIRQPQKKHNREVSR